jgi:catalase
VTATPRQAVEAIEGLFGHHPAARVAHARGTMCRGTFRAAPAARALTRAAHMQGHPVEVTVRFSNAAGDPAVPDYTPDARGMATKFHLDGGDTDMVAVTLPCFFVRTPEDFLALNRALKRNPGGLPKRHPLRFTLFVLTHREALRPFIAVARLKPAPSYANYRYNAIHTFRWRDSDDRAHHVRYSWVPDDGERSITVDKARKRGFDYLQQELYERFAGGEPRPLRFTLELQLAPEGEIESGRAFDPTTVWSNPQERVEAGSLEVTGFADEGGEDGPVVFDPARVVEGIELPPEDRILNFRPPAYDVSATARARQS